MAKMKWDMQSNGYHRRPSGKSKVGCLIIAGILIAFSIGASYALAQIVK